MLGFCNLILPRSAILIFFFLKVAKISLFFLIYPYLCSDPLSKNFIRFQLQLPFCHRKSWKEFIPPGCRAHAVHAGWLRTPTRCMLWQHGGSRAALLCTAVVCLPSTETSSSAFLCMLQIIACSLWADGPMLSLKWWQTFQHDSE